MKVAFVTTQDPFDVRAWSGIVFHMMNAVRDAGAEIETIGKLIDPYRGLFRAKRLILKLAFGKNYLREREPLTLRAYARQVERRVKAIEPDIVLSPGTIPIAFVQTTTPIIFWSDATFAGMIDFYPEFSNLPEQTIRNGHAMEQAALTNCRLAIYSSDWAAQTAITNYNVDRRKIKVIPFGGNLTRAPEVREIQKAVKDRNTDICKLLFIGVDWYRKGGDLALSVASILNARGVATELHVVGCYPPAAVPGFVKKYGYLSKANEQQNALLFDLYKDSTFFILPSRAECAAVVIAEASAHGLPALATKVGGMNTTVVEEVNGRTFNCESFVEDCADYIVKVWSAKERYQRLCESSFEEYAKRLNWRSAARRLVNLIASEGIAQAE